MRRQAEWLKTAVERYKRLAEAARDLNTARVEYCAAASAYAECDLSDWAPADLDRYVTATLCFSPPTL